MRSIFVSGADSRAKVRFFRQLGLVAVAVAALTACSRNQSSSAGPRTEPMIVDVKTQPLAAPVSPAALRLAALKARHLGKVPQRRSNLSGAGFSLEMAQPAIAGDVTFKRSEIFNRTFLYGSDLQYSTQADEGMGTMTQVLALGHLPATFRIMGDRLQLVADQSYQFESNINHPERLIHEWPITAQSATTVTVRIRGASPVVWTALTEAKGAKPDGLAPRSTWVRSIEYVAQGNYLLLETSVEQADGAIGEYLESLFPRDTLVSDQTQPLYDDAAREPMAERFRFLSDKPIYLDFADGRAQTKIANRFVVEAGGLIEWWVTPNIPEEYIPLVKAGVEGWNRYSQKMWGRDLVKFQGVLPEGVKIGDPRYNVISWDSVPDAGAAYESQAFDPTTGVQSHSLIYLPYAWIKIGKEYWERGELTQQEKAIDQLKRTLAKGSFLGRPFPIRCFREATAAVSLSARRTPDEFAKALLKQTLFHEVGHALGLAHNFKGSLSYESTKPGTLFSTSIMDYNQYQIEDAAYESLDSSNGPVLEYDRQIISVLYNEGKDIAGSDPVLPACADEEADSEADAAGLTGVDPLCIRYDAGSDPTRELLKTLELTRDPKMTVGRVQSLPITILSTTEALGDAATVATEKDVQERMAKLTTQFKAVASYYYVSGAQSLARMTNANAKSLFVFADKVLPEGYDEAAMRDRVATTLLYIANRQGFEPAAKASYAQAVADTAAWLKTTPWWKGLSTEAQQAALTKTIAAANTFVENLEKVVFGALRTSVFGGLKFSQAPFYFNPASTPALDYERLAIDLLEAAASAQTGVTRSAGERLAALESLKTFKDFKSGQAALERLKIHLDEELSSTRTTRERESVRSLLKALEE
jgi:hypothetical protein